MPFPLFVNYPGLTIQIFCTGIREGLVGLSGSATYYFYYANVLKSYIPFSRALICLAL